jgi:replicative DNA helicase
MFYARGVKSNFNGRKLKGLGHYLTDSTETPEEKISKAYLDLSDIGKKSVKSKILSVGESVDSFMVDLFDENGATDDSIKTGFSDLDDILWGIYPSDFFVLAARPSIGKTAFSMQVASNIAKKNKRVLFLSLEMSNKQLTRRLLSLESGVSYQRILKSQHLSKDNKEALAEAADRIKTLPLEIDDSSGQLVGTVRMKAQQVQASRGLDIIMIDYLQLLCPGGDTPEEVTRVSNGLKAIAKDLNIVVWGVSQLSRSIEYRESRRPQLSDLRGSGSLEQDANLVTFLYRPKRDDKTKIEAVVEKHTNGPLGAATFAFDNDTVRFSKGSW